MSPVDVRPVGSRADLTRFIRLPWSIYRNSPQWVPPLIFERKQFLNRKKNPFFEHAEAELFIAWRGRKPVGRISAQIDRDFNEHQGHDWGMFGFFECEDDHEAAGALHLHDRPGLALHQPEIRAQIVLGGGAQQLEPLVIAGLLEEVDCRCGH